MRGKLILTDVDGVLLHWEFQFDLWMKKHGYINKTDGFYNTDLAYGIEAKEANRLVKMFNETVYAGNLPPLYDAIKYTKKLHENYGVVFHAITSIGADSEIVESRVRNLHKVFGKSMWYNITCLDPAVSKTTVLQQYQGSNMVWVEDHPHNYAIGEALSLECYLMSHHYNANSIANRIFSWKEIYDKYP